jgi:hypothetical protein
MRKYEREFVMLSKGNPPPPLFFWCDVAKLAIINKKI